MSIRLNYLIVISILFLGLTSVAEVRYMGQVRDSRVRNESLFIDTAKLKNLLESGSNEQFVEVGEQTYGHVAKWKVFLDINSLRKELGYNQGDKAEIDRLKKQINDLNKKLNSCGASSRKEMPNQIGNKE